MATFGKFEFRPYFTDPLEMEKGDCRLCWQCPKCGRVNKEGYVTEGDSFKMELSCYKNMPRTISWPLEICFTCKCGATFRIWMEPELDEKA